MYFFSNFTEEVEEYTDDPNKLKRMLEFATNFPSDILMGSSGSSLPSSSQFKRPPEDNTLNYFADGGPAEITTPKCALCSAVIRITDFEITIVSPSSSSTSASSSSSESPSKIKVKYPIAEKPTIVNWVGDRFATDYVQPVLVNKVQRMDWSTGKQETDLLTQSALDDDPQRQMEYYAIIDSIDAKMHPGYTSLDFGVRPIVDIYGDSLYHVFVLGMPEGSSTTDKYYLEVNPDDIFGTPTNIHSYEWEHSAIPTELNQPGLVVEDDPDEDTPDSKTNTHYVVMRLKMSSSITAMEDYCDKT
jgi:hypothetical protein